MNAQRTIIILLAALCIIPFSAATITGFQLVDAVSDTFIQNLNSGDEINTDNYPNINVIATTSGSIGSVVFSVNGQQVQTENAGPYALGGDSSGNYDTWNPPTGQTTITARSYSGGSGGGSLLDTQQITITFTNSGGSQPPQDDPPAEDYPTFSSSTCWADSFSVNGKCYCNSNLDHTENGYLDEEILTPDGLKTVREICIAHDSYPKPSGTRSYFNDVQCGNGPKNAASDEQICQGIPNSASCGGSSYSGPGCTATGPTWDLSMFQDPNAEATITGELRKWHKITLAFEGPQLNQETNPNPVLNYRLDVTFTGPNGQTYNVPGFFAADGNAANTESTTGKVWKTHFRPDQSGTWNYQASFREGNDVSISTSRNAGSSAGYFDGVQGSFSVANTNKQAPDLRAMGRCTQEGHYLIFEETGQAFLKGGPDAPENLLAYSDFSGNFKTDGIGDSRVRDYDHRGDWNSGDPTWNGGKGKGLIGAVNYLASKGMNTISFLTYSRRGDDDNVFPFSNEPNQLRYDVPKLEQWDIFVTHANNKGLATTFKLQETENIQNLDSGNLGRERKLYYREIIARFGHSLCGQYIISEEYDEDKEIVKDFTDYIREVDPYDSLPVTLHTYPGAKDRYYPPMLGYQGFGGLSMQFSSMSGGYSETKEWIDASAQAGEPWVVAIDEPGNAGMGLECDGNGNNHEDARKQVLWPHFMAKGTGIEWYFGYNTCFGNRDASDLTLTDFRTRDNAFEWTRHATKFFQSQPVQEMDFCSDKVKGTVADCLGKQGEKYLLYVKQPRSPKLTMPAGTYQVRWYNPNTGTYTNGNTINGGNEVDIGASPYNDDAAAIVTRTGTQQPADLTISISPNTGTYQDQIQVTLNAPEPGARIFYTTDGSNADSNDQEYSSSVTLTQTTTIKAKAYTSDLTQSGTQVSRTYTITQTPICGNGNQESGEQCDDGNTQSGDGCSSTCQSETSTDLTVTFTPSEGTYDESVTVAMSVNDPQASIKYTLDGSNPTIQSSTYTGPLTITQTRTLKARAFVGGIVTLPEVNNGFGVIEAEDFIEQRADVDRRWYVTSTTNTPNVNPDPDSNHASTASGGAYVEILPDTRVTDADPIPAGEAYCNFPENNGCPEAILSYNVRFDEPGRYYVWVSAYSTGVEDNGIHVGLNGEWPSTGHRMQWCTGKNSWYWNSAQRTNNQHCGVQDQIYLDIPTSGVHEIMFSMREDGFEFDKFLLTDDINYQRPTGTGPDVTYSSRGGGMLGPTSTATYNIQNNPTITLQQGWNLISHVGQTVEQLQNSCPTLLVMYRYEQSTNEYEQANPASLNEAVWAWTEQTCNLEIESSAQQPDIKPGWNFVPAYTNLQECEILAGPYIYSQIQNQWIQTPASQIGQGQLVYGSQSC